MANAQQPMTVPRAKASLKDAIEAFSTPSNQGAIEVHKGWTEARWPFNSHWFESEAWISPYCVLRSRSAARGGACGGRAAAGRAAADGQDAEAPPAR